MTITRDENRREKKDELERKMKCILELVSDGKTKKAEQMSGSESMSSGHAAYLFLP